MGVGIVTACVGLGWWVGVLAGRRSARGGRNSSDDAPFEDETDALMQDNIDPDPDVDDEEDDGEELIGDQMDE